MKTHDDSDRSAPLRAQGVDLTLRAATPDDATVLRYWDRQPHVLASSPNDDWDWEVELQRDPPWREQLIAELDGKAIGFVQIIDPALEDSHYWGEVATDLRAIDIWIGEPSDLGQGHGTRMMALALERVFSSPDVMAVLVDPLEINTRAHCFYERFGFEHVGARRFGFDDCLVLRLNRSRYGEVAGRHARSD